MDNGRLQKYASKRLTAWSKRTMPGWWSMFLVVLGVGFFLYLAHAMVSGDTPPRSTLPPVAPAATQPTAAAPLDSPTTAPTQPVDGVNTGPVAVPRADGKGTVSVPGPAAALATLSFKALYDPSAAAKVPTTDGGVHQAPAATLPGTVRNLKVVDAAGNRYQFTAIVDVDGPSGELAPVATFVTVARTSGTWAFVNTAG